jgi:hypothetical protein
MMQTARDSFSSTGFYNEETDADDPNAWKARVFNVNRCPALVPHP